MIDWVTALLPWNHTDAIHGGQITRTKADGSHDWTVNMHNPVKGSHDATIRIKSDDRTRDPVTGNFTHIVFDGNPVKFHQGHNLWGTNDLVGLMSETCNLISNIIDLPINDFDWFAMVNGAYNLKRVDSTIMVDLDTIKNVRSFLYSAERLAHMRYKGQGVMKDGTLYFGKNSRRESLKMYAKGDEIRAKGHELPLILQSNHKIYDWADSKLRIEDVMRSMQLKDNGLQLASNWNDNTPNDIVFKSLSGIDMSEQHTIPEPLLKSLPAGLKSTFVLWREGYDLRAEMAEATFKRHRKQLKEIANIDIAIKQPREEKQPTNVVEFRRVLSPTLCPQVPDWAIGTNLYFEPRIKITRN